MRKLNLILLGAIILLLFFSRALIVEVNPESVPSFEDTKYPKCHLKIEIKEWTDALGS